TNNILKPSDGKPVTMPTQDMVIGLYWLTTMKEGVKGEGRAFSSPAEAIMAYDRGELDLQAKIKLRLRNVPPPRDGIAPAGCRPAEPYTLGAKLSRAMLNETLPDDFPFVGDEIGNTQLSAILNEPAGTYPNGQVATSLDALKVAGFPWAPRSGVTLA